MKAFLMHRNRDFRLGEGRLPNAVDLIQDLELDTLFDAMAGGDSFLRGVAKYAVSAHLQDPESILYRQHVLTDCLSSPGVVREIYAMAVNAIEGEKQVWSLMWEKYPEAALQRATEVVRIFVKPLRRLRQIAANEGPRFSSEGFKRFFSMISAELDEEYMRSVEGYLERLEFKSGIPMSAELGNDCKGANYILRKSLEVRQSWFERLEGWVGELTGRADPVHVYVVDDRDQAGFKALEDLRVQGIRHVASALTESADHVLSFFNMLRLELGFYVGCLNLHARMASKQEPVCFPEPLRAGSWEFRCEGLFDICLSLKLPGRVVGNDVNGDGRPLVVITGANRGGKTTFLRSVGLAQTMMQCGMFVPAEFFRANVCHGMFSHFKREEDASMKRGKLDEELSRMSTIVEAITPGSIVLMNESFASTNEREGSEIAAQIVRALVKMGITVFYVTHLFALADRFYRAELRPALFLRAERLPDGQRTYRLLEGAPLPTSFGEDVYRRIFEAAG